MKIAAIGKISLILFVFSLDILPIASFRCGHGERGYLTDTCLAAQQTDTYATRSSYAPAYVGSRWWTDRPDRPEPTEENFAWMAKMCDEYRSLRHFFSCHFYPLENGGWSYAHGGWAAYRYDRPEAGDGMIMAFRRRGSNCTTSCYVLEGLDADATYSRRESNSYALRREFFASYAKSRLARCVSCFDSL